jgi:hypothetical protein
VMPFFFTSLLHVFRALLSKSRGIIFLHLILRSSLLSWTSGSTQQRTQSVCIIKTNRTNRYSYKVSVIFVQLEPKPGNCFTVT